MRAILLPGDQVVEVVDRPDTVPREGEVLIRLCASFICRSDMSLYHGDPIVGGTLRVREPSCPATSRQAMLLATGGLQ
jgi:threonine dehydrogenase-like Zn-dependent dehydrogenase